MFIFALAGASPGGAETRTLFDSAHGYPQLGLG
jgi:hypothetical protein